MSADCRNSIIWMPHSVADWAHGFLAAHVIRIKRSKGAALCIATLLLQRWRIVTTLVSSAEDHYQGCICLAVY